VGTRGIEAEQDGEGFTRAVGPDNRSPVKSRLLDLDSGGRDSRIRHPGLTLGVDLSGIEPIEQLAEEIGLVLAHT
jgi:hypothetical protein